MCRRRPGGGHAAELAQRPTDALLVQSTLTLNSVSLRDCFDEEVKRDKFLVCQTRTIVDLISIK